MIEDELAQSLRQIIIDYQAFDGDETQISERNIKTWANQFNDPLFILTEMNHLLPKCYVSKKKGIDFFNKELEEVANINNVSKNELLKQSSFLNLQGSEKSQAYINELIIESLIDELPKDSLLNKHNKKFYFYFDDIIATGGTIRRNLKQWLESTESEGEDPIVKKIKDKKIKLYIIVLGLQNWGWANTEYYLMQTVDKQIDKLLNKRVLIEIENHPRFRNQQFNCCYPIKNENEIINTYFNSLEQMQYEASAFRPSNLPIKEEFYSNAANRNKLEQEFLLKGIELLNKLDIVKQNQRPLGFCHPNHKILGCGTMFFSWRNIPNNSPLVFWWNVPGHNWTPLFNVINRGS
ncbi:hypothetical protein C900_02948 [Fulvivirga imtechensis AK7]|uniref:PRTase-CE domain-containing protein n=1 Tax=Fulvivirga imtechensis AK7 TaxID=1237149 RepID=L8JUB7_9BACT|nr:hypothetical protein [Fulvivirga imtechensis]ELR71144.1 hypothetical protein C900_02948 [Fulvivirga imtechensis AK7]